MNTKQIMSWVMSICSSLSFQLFDYPVVPSNNKADAATTLHTIATLPKSSWLTVAVTTADVDVVSNSAASAITLASNNIKAFQIHGTVITEATSSSNATNGNNSTSVRSSSSSNTGNYNSSVSVCSSSSGGQVVTINGKSITVPNNAQVSVINGELFVDGKKVTLDGKSSAATNAKERNHLVVTVPAGYQGQLTVDGQGCSVIHLNKYSGYAISLNVDDSAKLTASEINVSNTLTGTTSGSAEITVDRIHCADANVHTNDGSSFQCNNLAAKTLNANAADSSTLTVRSGGCAHSSLGAYDSASIHLSGAFPNTSRRLGDAATITVNSQ